MPTPTSTPTWVPPANAVRAQFASRPTLEDVTQRMLAEAITEKYPSLRLDLSRVRLATPRPGGGWELPLLMPRVLDYLANGTPLDLRPIDHQFYFLSDEAGNWLEPTGSSLDMQVIETLIKELPWSVPIGLQNALSEYWAGSADTGVNRWRWLSDVLKDTLSISTLQQGNLSAQARETLNQVIQYPEYEERIRQYPKDPTHGYYIETTFINNHATNVWLSSVLVLVRSNVVVVCKPDGAIKTFSSLDAFIERGAQRLGKRYSVEEIRIKRYETDGSIFDAQASVILDQQLKRIGALKLPTQAGLKALQTVCQELTDPSQYLLDIPQPDLQTVNPLKEHLPAWLQQASVAEQTLYRQYSLALAHVKKNSQGRTFLSGITDIHSFAAQALHQQMRLEQERLTQEAVATPHEILNPDDIELTFLVSAGWPDTVGITQKVTMSLTDLALKNLTGRPRGTLTLRHRLGLALPAWLTPDYITQRNGLIEHVNIGLAYPQTLQHLLLGDTPDALAREQLFAEQLRAQLPLQALELSLKKENGLTALGTRYVAAVMGNKREVDGRSVSIRHLALIRRPDARPDVVTNMYIIEPSDMTTGPHVLYRPLYAQPLHEFSSRTALLEAIATPGELQASVLTWLPDVARPIYDNGGFQEPHYVRFGQGSEFSPVQTPQPAELSVDGASDELMQYQHNGKLLQFLYSANAKALVDQADNSSVSNNESRWGVFLEGSGLLFNILLLPFLRGPAMMTGWLLTLATAASKDIPALNSDDPTIRELAVVDMLLNLGMLLFEVIPNSPPASPLPEKIKQQVVQARMHQRIAKQWPERAPSPVVAGATALPGEVPGPQSTLLDFRFTSADSRLTPSQRTLLSQFEVAHTKPLPPPMTHTANKGLYLINNQWHAVVQGRLYRVSLEADAVVIVDPLGSNRRGPYLKVSDDGHWSLDLRLRLHGGMPPTRVNAMRQHKAQRISELKASLNQFIENMEADNKRIDILEAVINGLNTETDQSAVYHERYQNLLQTQTNSYLQLLESNKERTTLQIPLPREKVIQLMHRLLLNTSKGFLNAENARKALTTEWTPLFSEHNNAQEAAISNSLRYMPYIKSVVKFNERSIYWLELQDQYLDELYTMGAPKPEPIVRLTDKRSASALSVMAIKELQFKYLKLPSMKELSGNLLESLNTVIDPLQEHVRTHAELNALELSPNERQEVLDSLVEHYGQALDALQGIEIIYADELDGEYFKKNLTLLEGLYKDVSEKLADEIKPPSPSRKKPPTLIPSQPGKPKKQIIKTRNKGRLIGELKPRGADLPIDVIEIRSEYDNRLLATYSEHEDGWDEVQTIRAAQPLLPARALTTIKHDARKHLSKVDDHLKRVEGYLKITRHPEDIEHVLQCEANHLSKLAAELEQALQAQPETSRHESDQQLVTDLHSNALRLSSRGKELRIELSLKLAPTHGNLKYLLDEKLVQIARLGDRVAMRGEQQDFIQEYAINDRQGRTLWYAHFHYQQADTPKSDYSVAHMKTKEQRKQNYYSQLAAAQGQQAVVYIHRGAVGKDLAERWFLPLAP